MSDTAESGVSSVTSTDGTVYLHTHHGESSEAIVAALRPYVGRMVHMTLPNNYGHCAERRVRLDRAEGTELSVYFAPTDYAGTHDAMDTAGLACVRVEPERN